MESTKTPFLDTIYHLRTIEQIILYNKIMTVSRSEEIDTTSFLETEYENEILEYPDVAPKFNPEAALWAAKTVYSAAQLLLFREHKINELLDFLPKYHGEIDASALLSADICLRFLPQIILEMKRLDADDLVIPILENHLVQFHYSVIGYEIDIEKINFDILDANDSLKGLYLNRIVERKAVKFAVPDFIKKQLEIGFGDYKKVFWPQL
jgi:hypothetical protein